MIKNFLLDLNGFTTYRLLWINRLFVLLVLIFTFSEVYAKNILVVILLIWLSVVKLNDISNLIKISTIKWLLLFVVLIGLSVFYTENDPSYTIKYLERFIVYLFVPMVLIYTSVRQEYIVYVINAFVLAMFVNEIISYGILFGWWLELRSGYPVYFMPHVFYSILLAFTIMILVYKVVNESRLIYRVASLIFLVTMIGNLAISGGRSGQVTLLIAFLFTMLLFYKISFKSIVMIVIAPVITFLLAYSMYSPFANRAHNVMYDADKAINNGNFNTSFGTRIAGFVLTAKMLEDNSITATLFGHGVGDLDIAKKETIKKYYPTQMNPQKQYKHFHSSFLDVIGWIGIVGLLFLLMFLVSLYKIKIKNNEMRYIKIVLFFVLIMSYFPDSSLDSQYIMLLTSVFVGLLLAQSKYEQIDSNILVNKE